MILNVETIEVKTNKILFFPIVIFTQTEQFTVLWILFAVIVLGNTAVLVTLFINSKSRKSRMNFFIKHLAIAGKNKMKTLPCIETFFNIVQFM